MLEAVDEVVDVVVDEVVVEVAVAVKDCNEAMSLLYSFIAE